MCGYTPVVPDYGISVREALQRATPDDYLVVRARTSAYNSYLLDRRVAHLVKTKYDATRTGVIRMMAAYMQTLRHTAWCRDQQRLYKEATHRFPTALELLNSGWEPRLVWRWFVEDDPLLGTPWKCGNPVSVEYQNRRREQFKLAKQPAPRAEPAYEVSYVVPKRVSWFWWFFGGRFS